MYQIHSAKNYKVNWKSKKRKKYEKQLTTSQQCCKADPRFIYLQRGIISVNSFVWAAEEVWESLAINNILFFVITAF